MASVSLHGVRKIYEDGGRVQVAVHGIDLDIADGEFLVLVGPSGCGKTTTLRMIAGLESVSAGELRIGERVVNDMPPKLRDVAMVFQNYALYPHMTAQENMAFALVLRKLPKSEIDARVRAAAAILGIEELLGRRPRQMSGGQRQRVALGRAIVRQPQVFLFDEPLSNLDAKLRVQMRREIARLHRQLSATMVYVTHDQVEAMTLGDRIVVMSAGEVQQVGTPLEVYDLPRNTFVAGFIGSPPMNLITGSILQDGGMCFRANDGAFAVAVPERWHAALQRHEGAPVMFGIRPEHLRIADATDETGIAARLDLVEPMGSELYLSLRTGAHDLTARVSPRSLPPIGNSLTLTPDPEHFHFFDATSTLRLA